MTTPVTTKVFIDEFKNSKVFGVWHVDAEGNKIGQYPIVSMGAKKLNALLLHSEEIQEFVKEEVRKISEEYKQ